MLCHSALPSTLAIETAAVDALSELLDPAVEIAADSSVVAGSLVRLQPNDGVPQVRALRPDLAGDWGYRTSSNAFPSLGSQNFVTSDNDGNAYWVINTTQGVANTVMINGTTYTASSGGLLIISLDLQGRVRWTLPVVNSDTVTGALVATIAFNGYDEVVIGVINFSDLATTTISFGNLPPATVETDHTFVAAMTTSQ